MSNEKPYALITGASSGIGKSIAFSCAERKMNLLLVSLPGEGLPAVAAEISSKFQVLTDYFETDLSQLNSPEDVYKWVTSKNYRVNILVNNAGIGGTSVFETSDISGIDSRILVNIRALVLLTRFFIPELKKNEQARIMNIGSLSAFFSIPYKAVYSASKAFVVSFSRALRYELKDTQVKVSVVCPNGVRTNQATNDRINAHGFIGKLTSIDVDELSENAVMKMLKGDFMYVPLKVNRFLLFLQKILPSPLQQRIVTREFNRELKKPDTAFRT